MSSGVSDSNGEVEPSGSVEVGGAKRQPSSLDKVFGTLQNDRRRAVIRRLEQEPETTTGDLAEHIASLENDVPRQEVGSSQRKTVYVSLYQSHLPKLDSVGAVSYDSDRGTVTPGESFAEFVETLDQFESPEQKQRGRWTRDYLTGVALLFGPPAIGLVAAGFATAGQLSAPEAGSDATLAVTLALFVSTTFFLVWAYQRSDSSH